MNRRPSQSSLPSAQLMAQRVFSAIERFLHVEAASGVFLLLAAAAALIWANSAASAGYQHFWHTELRLGVGSFEVAQSLHFLINDGLMTIFFLVVGMEIRREIHEGALANMQLAALPLVAAAGGVLAPAAIYLSIVEDPALQSGWAVPIATDIAFAVGVLALLGKSIPAGVRIFLLALAIIDDIAAVLIIALFYSSGINPGGLVIAALGVLIVWGMRQIGVRSAWAFVIPGAVLWFGLLHTGVHPTLAGVILGLMTPVHPLRRANGSVQLATDALSRFDRLSQHDKVDARELMHPVRELQRAERDMLPPVVRVQLALHPWVAYGVMPIFALANAGVSLQGLDFSFAQSGPAQTLTLAIALGLVLGKPLGIFLASWLSVRLKLCQLPPEVSWSGVLVVGLLGGIGFTMSIFIATLAFASEELLAAAKLGVLVASGAAGVAGLLVGRMMIRRMAAQIDGAPARPLGAASAE